MPALTRKIITATLLAVVVMATMNVPDTEARRRPVGVSRPLVGAPYNLGGGSSGGGVGLGGVVFFLVLIGAIGIGQAIPDRNEDPEKEQEGTQGPMREAQDVWLHFINAWDRHGWTHFHYVAMSGDVGYARELIEAGADINAKDKLNGWTPLKVAQVHNREDMVEFLKQAGGV